MTIEQLAEEALALPSESRALLADRIVESLDVRELSSLDQLWATEAKRRRDEVREGRVKTIPGDEAFLKVRSAVGRE
jgi:putative addiction module component (TIGR02574 family)